VAQPQPKQTGGKRRLEGRGQAFLVHLEGTVVDIDYQHLLARQHALDHFGIQLSVWRIHRNFE
jgi:hypothetical protein